MPTIAETVPGFESVVTWFAIVAPPKTPRGDRRQAQRRHQRALRDPDILERMAQLSAVPMGGTLQATAAYMREEIERWHKADQAANIKLDSTGRGENDIDTRQAVAWPKRLTRVPYWIYSDADIFAAEQARIFQGEPELPLEAELPGLNTYRRSNLGAMPNRRVP